MKKTTAQKDSIKEDFKKIWEIDSSLCRHYLSRFLGIIALTLFAIIVSIIVKAWIYIFLCVFACISILAINLYELNNIITGKALAYSGKIVRISTKRDAQRKLKKILTEMLKLYGNSTALNHRAEIVIQNENGKYISFYPNGKFDFTVGDEIMIYASTSYINQIDKNSYHITNYYYMKITNYA